MTEILRDPLGLRMRNYKWNLNSHLIVRHSANILTCVMMVPIFMRYSAPSRRTAIINCPFTHQPITVFCYTGHRLAILLLVDNNNQMLLIECLVFSKGCLVSECSETDNQRKPFFAGKARTFTFKIHDYLTSLLHPQRRLHRYPVH